MAESKRGAGQLDQLVAFDERAPVDDGYGNTISGDFVEKFKQRAGYTFVRGDERVDAGAVASQMNLIIRTRNSPQARTITAAWQARDARKGTIFNIKTVTTDNTREFLELYCEQGVATG